MSVIHGRFSRVYLGATTATPVPGTVSFSLEQTVDMADSTAQGDTNKSYVAGLADCGGKVSGHFDDTDNTLWVASTNTAAGIASKMYLYPKASDTGRYWYGTAWVDFSFEADKGDTTKINGTWKAAGKWTAVGMSS